ncbi:MAG: copper resistance protein CopC [Verrucomicrobia bacterium]|nr:MAG: copper resistance protein CopC [Verrucomicrobiota bacterium]
MYRQRCRLHRAIAFLSGRSFPSHPGSPAFRWKKMKRVVMGLLPILVAGSATLEAHAFLERAEPAVGSTVQTSPSEVRVLFTENIEPALSTVQVFDASGKEVDKRDMHLDRLNHALLRISLPRLEAGTYKVVWRVVSVDAHVTNGNFTFRVAR